MVEGRASIVTSPGGTAAPGSWIHHVGVLNADRVLVRRRRASVEARRRRRPADREAGGRWRHVWCARQIAYLSLPFCALMRALTRTAASLLVDAAEAEPATAAVLELAELVQFAVVVT